MIKYEASISGWQKSNSSGMKNTQEVCEFQVNMSLLLMYCKATFTRRNKLPSNASFNPLFFQSGKKTYYKLFANLLPIFSWPALPVFPRKTFEICLPGRHINGFCLLEMSATCSRRLFLRANTLYPVFGDLFKRLLQTVLYR